MGFWQTGYIEFHEPYGLDEAYVPTPPKFTCILCSAVFDATDELQKHRFGEHPFIQPALFVRGQEMGGAPQRINQGLTPKDIKCFHATGANLNGRDVSLADLAKQLAKFKRERADITLKNDGVAARFSLEFEIVSPRDLAGVDRCFLSVAKRGRLDMRSVEDFIASSRKFETAMPYCDGICDYFYGVLAKEQVADTSLPYHMYREKFGHAVDLLKDIDSLLARTIRSIIAFHYNHFEDCIAAAGTSRVGLIATRFECLLRGDAVGAATAVAAKGADKLERLLTDAQTEQIIAWCSSPSKTVSGQANEIESFIQRDLPETDRAKLRMVLAESALSNNHLAEARRHARELRNNPVLGPWSESLLDRIREQE
jgi:hypothetical protein